MRSRGASDLPLVTAPALAKFSAHGEFMRCWRAMRAPPSVPFVVISLALSACAPRSSPPITPVAAPAPTEVTSDRPEPAPELAPDFRALVAMAAAREGEPDAHCVLAREPGGLRIVGVSSPALRPLPPPDVDVDAALARSALVNILTPFGRYGAAADALSLASFTYAPPTREALALVVSDQGIALRGTRAEVAPGDKLTRAQVLQALAALPPATVFVSAEAQVPASELAELLRTLQEQRVPVALAVNLAPATRLGEAPPLPTVELCAGGLPDTSEPEGVLDASALANTLSELRTHAAECLGSAEPQGMAGGSMSLLLRVRADGALGHACFDRDEIGDARLRACILGQAQKLRFPAPKPRGSVDLALPLKLAPSHLPAAPLLCP